jgi:hypothetical protein
MKAAIISALVAAVVSAGSATAAFVVTSKNIKNGTIQPIDLSAAAKKAMRGPQGLQGPPGVTGTTAVAGNNVILGQGEQGISQATCPNGKVTGGGWTSYLGNVRILRMAPVNGTWVVVMVNDGGGGNGQFEAEAVCLSP